MERRGSNTSADYGYLRAETRRSRSRRGSTASRTERRESDASADYEYLGAETRRSRSRRGSTAPRTNNLDDLLHFLNSLHMEQHLDLLTKNGFSSLDIIRRSTVSELEDIGMLKGHAIAIVRSPKPGDFEMFGGTSEDFEMYGGDKKRKVADGIDVTNINGEALHMVTFTNQLMCPVIIRWIPAVQLSGENTSHTLSATAGINAGGKGTGALTKGGGKTWDHFDQWSEFTVNALTGHDLLVDKRIESIHVRIIAELDSTAKNIYAFPQGVDGDKVSYVLALQSQLSFLARRKTGVADFVGRKIVNAFKTVTRGEKLTDFEEIEFVITEDLFSVRNPNHKKIPILKKDSKQEKDRKELLNMQYYRLIPSEYLLFESFEDVLAFIKNN